MSTTNSRARETISALVAAPPSTRATHPSKIVAASTFVLDFSAAAVFLMALSLVAL